MTGFLNRLSGFATGSPVSGAARLALPPRFAPASAAQVLAPDRGETDWIALDNTAPVSESHAESGFEHKIHGWESVSFSAPAERKETRPAAPEVVVPVKATLLRQTADRGFEIPVESTAEPMTAVPSVKPPVHVTAAVIRNAATIPRLAAIEISSAVSAAARTTTNVAPTLQDTRVAPLNPDILASRPQAARNDPPVYVTIDRIDVRVAPPAKPAVPPTHARRTASVSLSDYLRGNDRGGRP